MNSEYLQLGGTVAIAIALIELVKFVINKYTKNGNGKKDSNQDVEIAIIKTQLTEIKENHIKHIQSSIEKIKEDVLDIKIDMAEIKALLKK